MASNYSFYEGLDNMGHLKRVSKRFGKMREITLKRYDDKIWIHLNDNSKCFTEDKKFDRSQSKYISLRFEELSELRQIIDELEAYNHRMEKEIKMVCCRKIFVFLSLIV